MIELPRFALDRHSFAIAVVATIVLWVLSYGMFPSVPLGFGATLIVFFGFYLVALGVKYVLRKVRS